MLTKANRQKNKTNIYICPNPLCGKEFISPTGLSQHFLRSCFKSNHTSDKDYDQQLKMDIINQKHDTTLDEFETPFLNPNDNKNGFVHSFALDDDDDSEIYSVGTNRDQSP